MLSCAPMNASTLFANLPNLITLGRLVLAPILIVLIIQPDWMVAFLLFLLAGASDGVDGFLAKRFDLRSELGAYLDPLADKALLMSVYVALAIEGALPATIAILVVSRDVMILGAVIVSWVLDKPVAIQPLLVSKANTVGQIVLAASVLGGKAFGLSFGLWFQLMLFTVAALTLASAGAYFVQWLRHMAD